MLSRRWSSPFLLLAIPLAFAACGDDSGGGSDVDMGGGDMTDVDMGGSDALPLCSEEAIIDIGTSELGATLTRDLDTTLVNTMPRDLGGCGGTSVAPQVMVRYQVPGTGDIALTVNTGVGTTANLFDTLVQVRDTGCELPSAFCFTDTPTDIRAAGTAIVQGGSTVHILVTGFSPPRAVGGGGTTVDRGAVTLAVTANIPTPPVLTELTAVDFLPDAETGGGDFFIITTTGSDDANDIVAMDLEILDGSGTPLGLFGGGATVGTFAFAPPPTTSPFTDSLLLNPSVSVVSMATAQQVRVRLVDATDVRSDPLTANIERGTLAELGEECDGTTTFCTGTRIECRTDDMGMDVCAPDDDLSRICRDADATAIDLSLLTPEVGTRTDPIRLQVAPFDADGVATSPCVTEDPFLSGIINNANDMGGNFALDLFTSGPEQVYYLELPAGALGYDVTVTTDLAGNPTPQPFEALAIYGRTNCVDSRDDELSCTPSLLTEDLMLPTDGLRPSHTFEAQPPGPLYVFIEPILYALLQGPADAGAANDGVMAMNVDFTVIPVLTTGATCDPAEGINRCAAGPCPADTRVCP
ncbi:MAG: hypothetical protein AAGH15_19390 [Myxococcota bacterium]